MAKARSVDAILAELSALKARSLPPDALSRELGAYLASKHSLVVARAAALAAARGAGAGDEPLEPALIAAFNRFMQGGPSTDKGCAAKKELTNALHELGCTSAAAEAVYLAGVRYVQLEPVWGGSEDSAAELRGLCAYGLVRARHPDAMNTLAELLADASHQTRILAARGIAYSGRDEGAALLRLKILIGDDEGLVLSECLSALRQLEGPRALDFFRRLLDEKRHAPVQESVLLTLGEMRHKDALALLRSRFDTDPRRDRRIALLLPIALSRLPDAIDFLIDLVRREPDAMALAALDALQMYREYAAVRDKIATAVRQRASPVIDDHFKVRFGAQGDTPARRLADNG